MGIKHTDTYSDTTLGGAISHLANFAPRSLGTKRKDETIILALPEAIQPGSVCSNPQVCLCLGQKTHFSSSVFTIGKMRVARDKPSTSVPHV